MKTILLWGTLLAALIYAVESHGVMIALDSFATAAGGNDYNVGAIAGQDPSVACGNFLGGWQTGTSAMRATNGGLMHELTTQETSYGHLSAYHSEGFANRNTRRRINYTPTDGTYYMSTLLRKTALTNHRDIFVGLSAWQPVNESVFTLDVAYIGIYDGGIGFIYGSPLDITTLLTHDQVDVDETYFALMQFDYSSTGPDAVTATIFDGSSAQVANEQFTGLKLDGKMQYLAVGTSDFAPYVTLDEIRFGTELSDVMQNQQLPGDLDSSGLVSQSDLDLVLLNWGSSETSIVDWTGGPQPDGSVSQNELDAVLLNWGNTQLSGTSAANVPEPCAWMLVAMCLLAIACQWRLVETRCGRTGIV